MHVTVETVYLVWSQDSDSYEFLEVPKRFVPFSRQFFSLRLGAIVVSLPGADPLGEGHTNSIEPNEGYRKLRKIVHMQSIKELQI